MSIEFRSVTSRHHGSNIFGSKQRSQQRERRSVVTLEAALTWVCALFPSVIIIKKVIHADFIVFRRILRKEDGGYTSYGAKTEILMTGQECVAAIFRDGKKEGGPEIFNWNKDKLFEKEENTPRRPQKKIKTSEKSIQDVTDGHLNDSPNPQRAAVVNIEVKNIILQAELENKTIELQALQEKERYARSCYSALTLTDEVIRMETGLPNKQIFGIVVGHVEKFQQSIRYFSGWRVEVISLQDQVFLTLMKMRQNYTNLHLAQLFGCSTRTVSNVILTYMHVLHKLLYIDCMSTVPSRLKNKSSAPESFSSFGNCRMVIDCTDVKIAIPGLMSEQKLTYSTYRGMNSFKVLIGVAPNAAINYVSKLYPGSVSDKVIVKDSGLLQHFIPGDLILADKGFLIPDIVPDGVTVNIPPFLNHGKFTDSEIKLTKGIAKCRIHVERANARLKAFKVLSFIPAYLRSYADKIVQLCAALVNLQNPLIKETNDSLDFE